MLWMHPLIRFGKAQTVPTPPPPKKKKKTAPKWAKNECYSVQSPILSTDVGS